MEESLDNKVILITGGTGSFGKKFIQTVLKEYKPRKIIVFSRDEMKQYEMRKHFHDPCMRYFIGDVRDLNRLNRAFIGVDYVIHAAALKIVPVGEYNPFEVVKTNIFGSENVITASIDSGVKKVIAISTDKASNPVNLYGASKLCSEKMFIAGNNYSPGKTIFSVARYGNVLGSRGSVVPFFKECRKSGEIPITDERMTRFVMTLKDAIELVLQALFEMKGGEIFIPKIPSIRIVDLARAIAPECTHKIIGIRPGEKLHESLVSSDEGIQTYEFEDKYVIHPYIVEHNISSGSGLQCTCEFEGYRSDNNSHWLSQDELAELINDTDCSIYGAKENCKFNSRNLHEVPQTKSKRLGKVVKFAT